ncbi:HAD family hydrolase [Actinopolyspora alba]|uniref:HAD family hydrolase n=1 Tax=Actinopolyspora alba TaxID=673379 RepID=UPI000B83AACB|nr:HAD family hydrolase [Actinopolyspora alba]
MRRPSLVASDVDGTLLDPAERVSERTARGARGVHDSGTPFVLVTGRPPRWIPRIVAGLGVAGTVVCSNGAVLYDAAADRVLHSTAIEPTTLREVTGELRDALPGCSFGVERSTSGAHDRLDQQFIAESAFHRCWPNPDLRIAARDELVGVPVVKLLVMHERMTSAEMAPVAEELIGGRLGVTYSTGAGLLELSAPGVNKAAGLARVAEQLAADPRDVIAFGDMPNDIPMLEWAGHGVAVGNAHPDVRQVADEVTTSNTHDGVATVLERWW